MLSVTFVCLGNICRSPMAEAVFTEMVKRANLAGSFCVRSFGTSDCEEGNPVYSPAARVLKEKGYVFSHRAKMIELKDIINSDYILVMDGMNLRDIIKLTGGNYADKIFLLGHFLDEKIEIDDPWYTHDFYRTYDEIYASCGKFLDYLLETRAGAFAYDKNR